MLATFDERTYTPGVNATRPGSPDHLVQALRRRQPRRRHRRRAQHLQGRPHLDHRHGPLRGPATHEERRRQQPGQDDRRRYPLGCRRGPQVRLLGHGLVELPPGRCWSPAPTRPIGIDVAKDGKVYWSEMGLLGTAAAQWNSTGAIMMHDQEGPANNKTTVGTILTRADHGNSEDGVLGFRLQPGFDLSDPAKRNVFVYYSPRPGAGDDWPLVSTPASSGRGLQRDQPLHAQRRGTLRGARLRAGDPEGTEGQDHWLPVGLPRRPDRAAALAMSAAPGWTSTRRATCTWASATTFAERVGPQRYQPLDYRSAERWDARKTSANTADLRGKVIRSRPTRATSPRTPRRDRHDVLIPAGNLFRVGTAATRPEIYGMGFRQPFTFHTDPAKPGVIGMGEYCNDASADRADRSSAGMLRVEPRGQAGNSAGRSAGQPVAGEHGLRVGTTRRRRRPASSTTARWTDPVRHQLRTRG